MCISRPRPDAEDHACVCHRPLRLCAAPPQAGGWHQTFKREYAAATGARWSQGTLTSVHRNTQRPASLWYHDNA